jgi:aminoglycoside phosphotransferase (APT) family kinase protein
MNGGPNIQAVVRQFQVPGEFVSATPHGTGHINESWCVVVQPSGAPLRFLLQRMNTGIFTRPIELMQNIERVTVHLARQVEDQPDRDRRVLTLIPALDGRGWLEDANGGYWRMYRFIERARSFDALDSTEQAFQAASAFGRFQQQLTTLPAPRLHDTIPDFHNTSKRLAALERSIAADAAGRAILAKPEIDFALARQSITTTLLDANLPERITHNDTKINNVLLDQESNEGICVIDLDTVMNGFAPYDFGDMVRTATSPAAEDERDLSRVELQFDFFSALVRGYLSTAGTFLTKKEKDLLAFSGKLITLEIGMRFLTDYLAGDTYYKVHRDGHNLDRCRTQFKLVESIERQEEKMSRFVSSLG